MKIEDIANVYQGITLSRIKKYKTHETEKVPIYSFRETEERFIDLPVDRDKIVEIPFTKEGMILLNLTSHRASIIDKSEEGMVIPSTFMFLIIKDKVNPLYLEWYFNESSDFSRKVQMIKQGSVVASISVQGLREMNIDVPPKDIQDKISNILRLRKRKIALFEEEDYLYKQLIKYINQGGLNNDK